MRKKLKWISCCFVALFLCGGAIFFLYPKPTAKAEEPIKVILDGIPLQFDVQPRIINDRTMVPMRVIFEALGADVDWDSETRTITATKGGLVVKATIGDKNIYVNGVKITMDVAPIIADDRTLVPVRFVSEALGCDVDWDGDTRTVYIFVKTYLPDDYYDDYYDGIQE